MPEHDSSTDDDSRVEAIHNEFVLFHVKIRNFIGKIPARDGLMKCLRSKPHIVCVSGSGLNSSIGEIRDLFGYNVVARRDRRNGADDRGSGGVIVFAREDALRRINVMAHLDHSETSWSPLHSGRGGVLLRAWYRPQCPAEMDSTTLFSEGYAAHSAFAIGTIAVGDLDVHQRSWLRHSWLSDSAEHSRLRGTCVNLGLKQKIRQPTKEREPFGPSVEKCGRGQM